VSHGRPDSLTVRQAEAKAVDQAPGNPDIGDSIRGRSDAVAGGGQESHTPEDCQSDDACQRPALSSIHNPVVYC